MDECISWLLSLYSVFYAERPEGLRLTAFEKSILLTLSKIIADSLAIRHLVLAGFDTSAKTILRSVSEYMEVLVAIIHQPAFAEEFVKSGTPETAQAFWEAHLRGGKLRRRVTAAWIEFFKEDGNRDTAEWFANWGRGANPIFSGLCHPSLAGGLLATIPINTHYAEDNWLGIWDDKAECSAGTIYIYLQYVFPILLLRPSFPFEEQGPHISSPRRYDESKELHRHVRIGRDILAGVILSLGAEGNAPHLFPEIDISIWGAEDVGERANYHDDIALAGTKRVGERCNALQVRPFYLTLAL